MITSVAPTICAWCLKEQGETPQPTDSHGICEPHAEQVLITAVWNRLQRTPSYVEQNAAAFAQEEDDE